MTITKFRETYLDRAVPILLTQIHLAEHCHIKAEKKEQHISELHKEPVCIVRKVNVSNVNPEYALVVGYRDYITAKNSGLEKIKAIIVPDDSRRAFLNSLENTAELWNTADVHEPKGWTSPNPQKISNCIKNFEVTGTFGKGIIVSPNGTILDGYAAVCAARHLGVAKVPVYVMTIHYWQKIYKKSKKYKKTT